MSSEIFENEAVILEIANACPYNGVIQILTKWIIFSFVFPCSRLFDTHPAYLQLFPFKDVPRNELPANKRYQAHCNAVIHGFSSIIDALDDNELIVVILTKIADSHVPRSVGESEFNVSMQFLILLWEQCKKFCMYEIEQIDKVTLSLVSIGWFEADTAHIESFPNNRMERFVQLALPDWIFEYL